MDKNLMEDEVRKKSDEIRSDLVFLVNKRSDRKIFGRSVLVSLRKEVKDARIAKISHAKIAAVLCQRGVKVHRYDVAQFCSEEFGEVKGAPKKKRKQKSAVSKPKQGELPQGLTTRSTHAQGAFSVKPSGDPAVRSFHSKANLERPGFRIIPDSEL